MLKFDALLFMKSELFQSCGSQAHSHVSVNLTSVTLHTPIGHFPIIIYGMAI